MRRGFYAKLAWAGIRSNKRLSLPYLYTCIGMVMMHFILDALSLSPLLDKMQAGTTLKMILGLGKWVLGFFALIFLFYTQSFLMRRRNKEFGLYNILGMSKKNINRIVVMESLIHSGIALVTGMLLGITLYKLAELGLMRILNMPPDYSLYIPKGSLQGTLFVFTGIFLLILLNSLRTVHKTNPLQLLHSEQMGEKPPRANWFFALAGTALLAGAYTIAVRIQSPVEALLMFFVAVIMVIAATYLLFTVGSVTLCRLLQRSKNFYYQKKHFVSVSSMSFRMKRSGAGLASICILSTVVLVMLTGCLSLYIGAKDAIINKYPKQITMQIEAPYNQILAQETLSSLHKIVDETLNGKHPEQVIEYQYASLLGITENSIRLTDVHAGESLSIPTDAAGAYILPLEDYNRIAGETHKLDPGEALVGGKGMELDLDSSLQLADGMPVRIIGQPDWLIDHNLPLRISETLSSVLYIVIPDYDAYCHSLQPVNSQSHLYTYWEYGFDIPMDIEEHEQLRQDMMDRLAVLYNQGHIGTYGYFSQAIMDRDFFTLYGGLFFIGILLSLVFILAAILIIYYKQISEGYEDCARFGIMQKVGMTHKDIRQSINSQVLTVFFAPLATAGLHLAFAFPMVWRMLQLFGLPNLRLVLAVAACAYLVFALCYILIYRFTSRAYFSIVSHGGGETI